MSPCPQEVTHPIKDTSKRALMDGLMVAGGSIVIAITSILAQEETYGMNTRELEIDHAFGQELRHIELD